MTAFLWAVIWQYIYRKIIDNHLHDFFETSRHGVNKERFCEIHNFWSYRDTFLFPYRYRSRSYRVPGAATIGTIGKSAIGDNMSTDVWA